MNKSLVYRLGARAVLGFSAVLLVACGSAGGNVAPSADSVSNQLSAPDALYGDWHEDHEQSTDDRQVFVPMSVNLGPSHYRRTLHFGRDGTFSTLRLDPADAHYECPGTFIADAPNKLSAECKDPKSGETVRFTIALLEVQKERLVVKVTP